MEELISFKNVIKKYGQIRALDEISFSIMKGESVALIGNNGCGKTTTINVLCNLILYDKGDVIVYNKKVTPLYVSYKNKFGILLSPPIFINEFTPQQYFRFICKFQKVDPQEVSDRIDDVINSFKISFFNTKKISDFSAGDRMKIALAAAIIHNPEVLIFDEPFIHLDIQTIDFLLDLISSTKNNKTLFITSHNLDLITKLCGRFLLMEKGKIVDDFLPDKEVNVDEIKIIIRERINKQKMDISKLNWLH
jgi:ABC-2 type transport system ATP-binding protein